VRLLRAGAGDFDSPLRELGVDVVGVESLSGGRIEAEPDLSRALARGGGPDAVLIVDDLGGRVLPTGLVRCPVPVIHYALDAPINLWWQQHYAAACDLTLTDQHEPAARLARAGRNAHWLPVGIDPDRYQGAEPDGGPRFDLGFVGVISEKVRPKRSRIIDFIGRHYRLEVAGGRREAWVPVEAAARLYRSSRLVLNENLFPGLTTRLLEGMACGRPVLTEGDNGVDGLTAYFQPGEDLICFGPDDLSEKLAHYVADDEARDRIARRGRDRCLAEHTLRRRAETMVSLIEPLLGEGHWPAPDVQARLGRAYLLMRARWPGRFGKRLLRRAGLHLKRAGTEPGVQIDLAGAALLAGEMDEARGRLEAAAESGHGATARLYLGLLELEQGRTRSGRDHLQAAARRETDPAAAQALNQAARAQWPSAEAYLAVGRFLAVKGLRLTPGFMRRETPFTMWLAVDWFLAALSLDTNLVPALTGLAEVLADSGAYTEAFDFYSRAVRLRPGDGDLKRAWQHTGRMGYCFLS
jgi:tetratricopeptide (TPR) repeat protein